MILTIAKDIRVEQVIQKSRFLCSLKKVATEEEAQAFLRAVKKNFGMLPIIAAPMSLTRRSSGPVTTGNRRGRRESPC